MGIWQPQALDKRPRNVDRAKNSNHTLQTIQRIPTENLLAITGHKTSSKI